MMKLKYLNIHTLMRLADCASSVEDRSSLAFELEDRKRRITEELKLIEVAKDRMRKHYWFLLKGKGKRLRLMKNLRKIRLEGVKGRYNVLGCEERG